MPAVDQWARQQRSSGDSVVVGYCYGPPLGRARVWRVVRRSDVVVLALEHFYGWRYAVYVWCVRQLPRMWSPRWRRSRSFWKVSMHRAYLQAQHSILWDAGECRGSAAHSTTAGGVVKVVKCVETTVKTRVRAR